MRRSSGELLRPALFIGWLVSWVALPVAAHALTSNSFVFFFAFSIAVFGPVALVAWRAAPETRSGTTNFPAAVWRVVGYAFGAAALLIAAFAVDNVPYWWMPLACVAAICLLLGRHW